MSLPEIDKVFTKEHLPPALNIQLEEIMFFGDKLEDSGNDTPVVITRAQCAWVKLTAKDRTIMLPATSTLLEQFADFSSPH